MSRRARALLSASALLAAAALTACGGEERARLAIDIAQVEGGAGFEPSTLTVDKRNRVELEVDNVTQAEHGFSIEGYGIQEVVGPGATLEKEFVAIKAGTYKIYCHLHPAHQTATLVVQ